MSSSQIFFSRYNPAPYTLTLGVRLPFSDYINTPLAGKYIPSFLGNIVLRSVPDYPALQGASITKNQPPLLDKGMNLNYPCTVNQHVIQGSLLSSIFLPSLIKHWIRNSIFHQSSTIQLEYRNSLQVTKFHVTEGLTLPLDGRKTFFRYNFTYPFKYFLRK